MYECRGLAWLSSAFFILYISKNIRISFIAKDPLSIGFKDPSNSFPSAFEGQRHL
jgi:hypothetical protein